MSDESLKQSIDYVEYNLKKDDLLKTIARKTRKIRTLQKRVNVLKMLPYLGKRERTKFLLKVKGYVLFTLALIPFLGLLELKVFESGYKQPMFMRTVSAFNPIGNFATHITMFLAWATILLAIALIIFGIVGDTAEYVLFVFSDRYLVNELKVLVDRLECRQQEHRQAMQELDEIKKELEKIGTKK
ncbi:hypothetical protein ABID30_003247 [Enterococcus rotai]|uniref:hypothetical protein n=1 Tax=Enterococcus rotai TaxID=118060 RepID=UPI00339229DA